MQNNGQESRLNTSEAPVDTNSTYHTLVNLLADKSLSDQELGLKIRELCGQTEPQVGDSNTVHAQIHAQNTETTKPTEVVETIELTKPTEQTNQDQISEMCDIANHINRFNQVHRNLHKQIHQQIHDPFHQPMRQQFGNLFGQQIINPFAIPHYTSFYQPQLTPSFDNRVSFMNNGFDNLWQSCDEMDKQFGQIKKDIKDMEKMKNDYEKHELEQNDRVEDESETSYQRAKHFSSTSININGNTQTKTVSRVEEVKNGKPSVYKKVTTGDDKNVTIEEFFPNGRKRVTTKVAQNSNYIEDV